MAPTIQSSIVGFIVLLVAFRALECFRPKSRRLRLYRLGFWTDVAYWLFTPVVTPAVTRIDVAVVAVPLALLIYGQIDKGSPRRSQHARGDGARY